MIVFEITNTEAADVYRDLAVSNGDRQYDFLRSIVTTALNLGRPFLSSTLLKALNFQAIACLHAYAGEYRPCPVLVGGGATRFEPAAHYRVQALMDDFVNYVNWQLEKADPVVLAAYVLWRLNYIHPFINGNGRTARAAAYFVLCVKAGGWLPGNVILPELIKRERPAYTAALKHADLTFGNGSLDLGPLHQLLEKLLTEQLAAVIPQPPPTP